MLKPKLHIQPPIIAHRGASCYAPENTLAAFKKAKDLGAKWVEFDVMLSSDGEAIVFHDDTLERTTNGSGRVIDYPYNILRTLDAGSWFNKKFAGEQIPSFIEVIETLHHLNLAANIEIKPLEGYEKVTAQKVVQILKSHWRDDMPQPLISSFSHLALTTTRKLLPDCMIGFLMHEWHADWEAICNELKCVAVDVNEKIMTEERVNLIKETNRALLVYMVNDAKRAKKLFSWGVDAVFSDDLIKLSAFL